MLLPNSKAIVVLFVTFATTLIFSNLVTAQEDEFENLFIRLEFAPPVAEGGTASYSIGYVRVADSEGSPVLAPDDLSIQLSSSNPSIASVPSEVVIPVNKGYVNFDVKVTETEGMAEITAIFQGQELTKPFRVGGITVDVPLNVELEVNLPTSNVHVGSSIPVSIFLNNSGTILQAPKDIKIRFQYERSLLSMQNDEVTIKQGNYYAIANIRTLDKTGTAFIKAISDEPPLENTERLTISSSLPKKLKVDVYPHTLIQKFDREIDMFVSLLDENDNPVKAEEDVPIEIFSNLRTLDDEFEKQFRNVKPVIKKGQWGFYYKQENILFQEASRQNFVGATSPGYGQAQGIFNVLEELDENSVLAENKTLALFMSPIMPPDSIGVMAYQLNAIKGSDDDQEAIDALIAANLLDPHPFADDETYEEEDLYPIKSKYEDLTSDALKARISTTDQSVVKVIDGGELSGKRSYGIAIIQSGKDGTTTISTAVRGLASSSNTITVLDDDCSPAQCLIQSLAEGPSTITVLDPKSPTETLIYSPAGKNRIVFNNEGLTDLYLILLDSAKRPTTPQSQISFSVKPTNELVDFPSQRNNLDLKVKSSSFARDLETGRSTIIASPVGINADTDLETQSVFEIAPSSSTVKIFLPFTKIVGGDNTHQFGIVQLADFFGNPVQITNDLQVELKTNNTAMVEVPSFVTIPSGNSFTTFPITTFGDSGTASISASTRGFFGSEVSLQQVQFIKELVIFPVGPPEAVNLGEGVEIQIFVDDENAISVEGADIEFFPGGNSTVFPQTVTTDSTGEARVMFTPNEGPTASLQIFASKPGYIEDQTTLDIQVAGFEEEGPATIFGIDPLILYAAIGGAVAGIGGIAFKLLRKPKVVTEEELEEEEI